MSVLLAILLAAAPYLKLDYLPDQAKPHPAGRKPAGVLVCLDPGHGGSASGTRSCSGSLEKDLNLTLASAIREALTNAGFRVVMTRDDDRDVDLHERPAVAEMYDADLFISVHHNSLGPKKDPLKYRGAEVYSWNPLGEALAAPIARAWAARNRHANFAVIRNPHVPSVLLEADYITHPDGDRDSRDASVIRRRAEGVVQGVKEWLKKGK